MSPFYIIVDPGSADAFLDANDDVLTEYATEYEAIAAAKNYSAVCYVVKAIAIVTPVERYKVTKLA